MNAGKSKVMFGSSGGKMIVNSGKWSCLCLWERSAGKLFSAQYVKSGFTNGVRGHLSLIVDGFRCK